jgi:hypothetical protein
MGKSEVFGVFEWFGGGRLRFVESLMMFSSYRCKEGVKRRMNNVSGEIWAE